MGYECKFCGRILSTKYSLIDHQKKTIICRLAQNELKDKNESECERGNECIYCKKIYTTPQNLKKHKCKIFHNPSEAKQKINQLEAELKASKSEISLLESRLNKEIETNKELLLKANSIFGDKIQQEYSVYDTNPNLDKNWLITR